MPACRLDAVRGKPQHALITITAKDGDVFIVDQVQLLYEEQAGQAKVAMGKLMFAVRHFHVSKKTRDIPWNVFFPCVGKHISHSRSQRHGRRNRATIRCVQHELKVALTVYLILGRSAAGLTTSHHFEFKSGAYSLPVSFPHGGDNSLRSR